MKTLFIGSVEFSEVILTDYLENKFQALEIYNSEIGKYPFPRSPEAVKALAMVRGVASGFYAVEAFQLLRERF